MNCFYHPQTVAVAICKNCNKGLCSECASDVGNGIACKGKCESEVLAINAIINRSKTAYQKTGNVYIALSIPFGILGLLICFGSFLSKDKDATVGGSFFGFFFIVMSVIFFIYGRKFKARN